MPSDATDEIELPNGETVAIPEADAVFPTFAAVDASIDVTVEQGRIRMREETDCEVTLGVANNDIEEPAAAVATLHADIQADEEDVYSEIALHSAEAMQQLRDALDLALRYRGVES